MSTAKLIQYCAMDLHQPTECELSCLECEFMRSVYVCPHCSLPLEHCCDINIESGSLESFMVCYNCGYTE